MGHGRLHVHGWAVWGCVTLAAKFTTYRSLTVLYRQNKTVVVGLKHSKFISLSNRATTVVDHRPQVEHTCTDRQLSDYSLLRNTNISPHRVSHHGIEMDCSFASKLRKLYD